MRHLFIIFFLIFTTPALADKREALYGTWGTEKQCARAPVVPGSLVQSEPFEINSQWLKRGVIWCKLSWFPVEDRQNGFYTGANAICGEDTIQRYILNMDFSNDELTILWRFSNKYGPLKLCSVSQANQITGND